MGCVGNRTLGRTESQASQACLHRDLVEPTITTNTNMNTTNYILVHKPPYPNNTNFVTGSPCCLALCRLRPQLGLDPSPDADVVNYRDLGGNGFIKDYVGAPATSTTVSPCPHHLCPRPTKSQFILCRRACLLAPPAHPGPGCTAYLN